MADVVLALAAFRMALRIPGAGEAEGIAAASDEGRQLAGVAEAVLRFHERAVAAWRVAAQGEHVLEPGIGEAVEDDGDLVAGMADAGEMRHGLEPVIALDARDDLDRLLARRAAGPVGHRDEAGFERVQVVDGAHEAALACLALGRKELEREHRPRLAEEVADTHNRVSLEEGRSRATECETMASEPVSPL